MQHAELDAWLRLAHCPGVGNAAARKLLAAFGLPQRIFEQSPAALRQVVSTAQAQALLGSAPEHQALLASTWEWLNTPADTGVSSGRCVWVLGDAAYPPGLLDMEDPPLLLYAMGTGLHGKGGPALDAQRSIAIVGSRNPTPQGQANAQQFAASLAQAGLTVVSGLALGIDGAAHEGALAGAQPGALATIAVVGTGLDRVYPKKHLDLAHRIARQGWLVSEYALGTPAMSANFPRRNRLIAGLARGVLVVEAAVKSGSLITARLGAEQGKEVFAIPGSIHSPQSRGCHALLKQGAKLVESAQDVLEELAWPGMGLPPAAPENNTSDDMNSIAEEADYTLASGQNDLKNTPEARFLAVVGFDPVSLDTLIARTGMDAAALQVQLLSLELAGSVARLPGGLFQRLGQA
ncbi:MAG: DNA-processing protein DprA [Burkholderiaceae bacterium]